MTTNNNEVNEVKKRIFSDELIADMITLTGLSYMLSIASVEPEDLGITKEDQNKVLSLYSELDETTNIDNIKEIGKVFVITLDKILKQV